MTGQTATERLLRRERLFIVAGLLVICLLSWAYVLAGAGTGMSTLAMSTWQFPPPLYGGAARAWPSTYWLIMLVMWWVMMIAMMLPSAAPTILLSAAINRRSRFQVPPYGSTAAFTLGYLLAWALFSLVAVLLQWALERAGMLSMHMESVNELLSGGLLVAAGLWQLSPIKNACLRHCRSPVDFLVQHRRPGNLGALAMGAHHGFYCLGCCWFLMALLFVGGVMNLYWIIGLAAFVYVEKVVGVGPQLARIAGAGLLIWGLLVLALRAG